MLGMVHQRDEQGYVWNDWQDPPALKRDLVRVIANICHGHKPNQDLVTTYIYIYTEYIYCFLLPILKLLRLLSLSRAFTHNVNTNINYMYIMYIILISIL